MAASPNASTASASPAVRAPADPPLYTPRPPPYRYPARSGEVAEWSNAPVLKTGGPQGPVGSNPTLSASPGGSSQHFAYGGRAG